MILDFRHKIKTLLISKDEETPQGPASLLNECLSLRTKL